MRLWHFFDRLEDKVRGWLTRHPFIYAVYGGIGIVLFWRGVWHGVDAIANLFLYPIDGGTSIDAVVSFYDSGLSFILGTGILLSCGLFVSELIGKEIIISGLRGEKRLTERTEVEVRTETGALAEVLEQLDAIHVRLEALDAARKTVKRKPSPPPLPPTKLPVKKS